MKPSSVIYQYLTIIPLVNTAKKAWCRSMVTILSQLLAPFHYYCAKNFSWRTGVMWASDASGLGDCGNAPPSGQARPGGKPWLDPHSVFWKVTTCFIMFQKKYIVTFRYRLYYLLQEIMWVTLFAFFFSVREAFRRKVKFHHNAKPQSRCFQTHWVVLCWF